MALLAFITAVEGVACESMVHLREFTGRTFPGITSAVDVAALTVAGILAAARRAGADAILLVGGPPCPPFSPLSGNPQGWSDPRTGPLRHFVRLKNGLAEACQREGLRFKWFMEEVATMAAVHRDEISRLLDAAPVLIHAADFGLVHRARYYWGLLPITCALPAAIEVLQAGAAAFGVVVLRWLGKPSPARWEPDGGFTWKFRGECGVEAALTPGTGYRPRYPEGRFLAFTTCYPHPADRPPQARRDDPHVYQRFLDDARRQPLGHYQRGNVVWKGARARALAADEREVLMGFPQGFTASLARGPHASVEDARRHALGNTFHVPSVMLVLFVLFGGSFVGGAAAPGLEDVPAPTSAQRWDWATQHAPGTVWQDIVGLGAPLPAREEDSAVAIFDQALLLLPSEATTRLPGYPALVDEARRALGGVSCTRLRRFERYLTAIGAPPSATGPDLQALWAKSPMHAAVGRQHRPGMAAEAAPSLLPASLAPEDHLAAAVRLKHPFAEQPPLELDMRYAVGAYEALGPLVKRERSANEETLRAIFRALQPLDEALLSLRPVSIEGASGINPAATAFLVVLLRWPDVGLPGCLALPFCSPQLFTAPLLPSRRMLPRWKSLIPPRRL